MIARLRSLWRALWHRSRLDRDLDDEMRFHLEARTEDLTRSGLAGVPATVEAYFSTKHTRIGGFVR